MTKPFTLRLSRLVGSRRFDEAIDELRAGLTGGDDDLSSLEMIALCQHWADRGEDAEATCREALLRFPQSFDLHKLLGELLAAKGVHDEAVLHVKQALLLVPEPLPQLPTMMLSATSIMARLLFRQKVSAAEVETGLRSGERANLEWVSWANAYRGWYEATHLTGQR